MVSDLGEEMKGEAEEEAHMREEVKRQVMGHSFCVSSIQ